MDIKNEVQFAIVFTGGSVIIIDCFYRRFCYRCRLFLQAEVLRVSCLKNKTLLI